MNQNNTHLVLDEALDKTLPRNFRTHKSPFIRAVEKDSKEDISRYGLEKLTFIASGQFSEKSLKSIVEQYKQKIWVVDLRRESHGFVEGRPISWYAPHNQSNKSLTSSKIETLENNLLQSLTSSVTLNEILKKKDGVILEVEPQIVIVKHVESERELVEKLGLQYFRLPVNDHRRPTNTEVDNFIKILRNLPKDTTLYFHCRAGKGRTTTFVVLWDMLINAKKLSFSEIVDRQHLLGGAYLTKTSFNPDKAWKAEWAKERWTFLMEFYQYAQQSDYREVTWSNWVKYTQNK